MHQLYSLPIRVFLKSIASFSACLYVCSLLCSNKSSPACGGLAIPYLKTTLFGPSQCVHSQVMTKAIVLSQNSHNPSSVASLEPLPSLVSHALPERTSHGPPLQSLLASGDVTYPAPSSLSSKSRKLHLPPCTVSRFPFLPYYAPPAPTTTASAVRSCSGCVWMTQAPGVSSCF